MTQKDTINRAILDHTPSLIPSEQRIVTIENPAEIQLPLKPSLAFIGTGNASNKKLGNTSAFIREGSSLFILDCGETTFNTIEDTPVLEGLTNIAIAATHMHSDHVGSLSGFIYYCYYTLKIRPIVFYPNRKLQEFLTMQGNTEEHYEFRQSTSFLTTELFKNGLSARFIPIEHFPGIQSYALDIVYNKRFIYYSGDTSELSNTLLSRLDYYTEIYHDVCTSDMDGYPHTSLIQLITKIPPKFREKVYCMHFDSQDLIDRCLERGFRIAQKSLLLDTKPAISTEVV